MIKIMLVDDEAIERKGLQMLLNKHRPDSEIVAEAGNGKEAIDLAMMTEPDLIFMDIKMPEYDGIYAAEQILTSRPKTKIIMVSAYDTFDYAKKAMKFGIKEYLLKPNSVAEVLTAYDAMVQEVDQENMLQSRLEQANGLIEMEFILTLLLNHVHDFDTESWSEWLHVDDMKGFVIVLLFQSEQPSVTHQDKQGWYASLKNVVAKTPYQILLGPLTGFQVPAFVKYDATNFNTFARSIIHQLQQELTNLRVKIGVGNAIDNLDQFATSYEHAMHALEQVQDSQANYAVYNNQAATMKKTLVPFAEEKRLLEAIKKGDETSIDQLFDRYFMSLQQNANYQLSIIKKAMTNFFVILHRVLNELGLTLDTEMEFSQFNTPYQIKEAAKAHLYYVMQQIKDWRDSGVRGLLLQAKAYMESNFEKNISLEQVATDIGLSSYYFSKLFKEYFEVTFIDYLTQMRLDRAKELLVNTNYSLKEIALSTGYKDPNYFSRVFKKEINQTPSAYRKNHK